MLVLTEMRFELEQLLRYTLGYLPDAATTRTAAQFAGGTSTLTSVIETSDLPDLKNFR